MKNVAENANSFLHTGCFVRNNKRINDLRRCVTLVALSTALAIRCRNRENLVPNVQVTYTDEQSITVAELQNWRPAVGYLSSMHSHLSSLF